MKNKIIIFSVLLLGITGLVLSINSGTILGIVLNVVTVFISSVVIAIKIAKEM